MQVLLHDQQQLSTWHINKDVDWKANVNFVSISLEIIYQPLPANG